MPRHSGTFHEHDAVHSHAVIHHKGDPTHLAAHAGIITDPMTSSLLIWLRNFCIWADHKQLDPIQRFRAAVDHIQGLGKIPGTGGLVATTMELSTMFSTIGYASVRRSKRGEGDRGVLGRNVHGSVTTTRPSRPKNTAASRAFWIAALEYFDAWQSAHGNLGLSIQPFSQLEVEGITADHAIWRFGSIMKGRQCVGVVVGQQDPNQPTKWCLAICSSEPKTDAGVTTTVFINKE